MDWNEYIDKYWSYYLIYEEEFLETTRYVSLDESNYATHSIEFGRLLVSICSEIDNVFKVLCKELDFKKRQHIGKYAENLLPKYPEMCSEAFTTFFSCIELVPFEK
ncbi:MAG: hypothetical protein EUB_03477 [Eubacterium sp.]